MSEPRSSEPRSSWFRSSWFRSSQPRSRWSWAVGSWVSGWLAVGLVAAGAWRWLTPVARGASEAYERDLAGDVTLAAIELAVGVIAGVVVLARSGPRATTRFAVAVLGPGAGSLVAWGVGRQLGAPVLTLTAVLLLAPFMVSLVTVVGSLVVSLVLRDPYGD